MKHFRDTNNSIFSFEEDGSQDNLIKQSMTAMTQQEVDLAINPPPTQAELAEIKANAWKVSRESAYDKEVNQLDQLWHDIDAGLLGDLAKTGYFYMGRKAVKDANPKPV